ncbi:MAG TPA: excinuclease ABC subunit UvrC [Acidimicrobiales bacterium]|nr:excinuclease ABC subunit UvrC [Acidimicrobiales bacterium]
MSVLQRPEPGTIPDAPGSYQFKDADGRVIYVGKARSLRSRLASYFQAPAHLAPRTAQMVACAESVEWIQVRNEVEAVMLEYSLIKAHRPRFNIRLRDDKSYPFLAVTLDEEWPRAMVMRGKRRKGVRYFGPYAHAYAIRETLDHLLRSFPVRTCSDAKFRRHQRLGRPCLLYHIEKCVGPCVGEVDRETYDRLVGELVDFLAGDTDTVLERLQTEMADAADHLEFERAARLRDRLVSVRKVVERQQMVTERSEDLDVIGLADDELEAAIQVFFVRRGRVVGRKGFVLDKVEDLDRGGLVAHVLEHLYAEPILDIPRQVLVPDPPEDPGLWEDWLASQRGAKVTVRVPQRGDKRSLQQTVSANAGEELTRHRLRRATDHNARARATRALQDALDLPEAPLRIECYDMSHLQGADYVGSMVVMEDGLAKPADYRRFRVTSVAGNDDYGAMEEVLTRRLSALVQERGMGLPEQVERRRGRRFAYPPQLLVLDGGKGQLGVGMRVLEELGLEEEIPVVALAKAFEEVYVPGRQEPVRIPRQSEALYLLQQIRDEAHRFAVSYHRQLRGKRMTRSALDGVPGLGPARRKRLVKELGSVKAVRESSLEDLLALSWLPDPVARAVHDHLHRPAGTARGDGHRQNGAGLGSTP